MAMSEDEAKEFLSDSRKKLAIENDNHRDKMRMKKFYPSGDRGFHHSDIHKAAEELRMEGKGSEDPMYPDSKKNK